MSWVDQIDIYTLDLSDYTPLIEEETITFPLVLHPEPIQNFYYPT